MKVSFYILALLIIADICSLTIIAQTDMKPPIAKKVPRVLKIHGYEITDNYFWLRDRNDKKDPEVIKYLTEENTYTDAYMKPHAGFTGDLYNEMLGRIKQTDTSVPYEQGDYWYFNRTEEGKQYPIYLRSLSKDGKDPEVVLDQNQMAEGHKFFSISEFDVSDDGNILAFSTDMTGYRQYTLQFKDLRTGKIFPDKIERVTSLSWATDNKNVIVVTEDAVSKRSDKMWRHEVGTDKNDLVYEEKDVLFNLGTGRTRDKQVIIATSYAKTMRETRYIPAHQPATEWKVVLPKEKDHEYAVDHYNGEFYIITNKNAENFRIVRAPMADPSEKNWKDFVAHNPAIKIEDINFFKNYAVVSEVENGLEYLRVIGLTGKKASHRDSDTGGSVHDGDGHQPGIRHAEHPVYLFLDDHPQLDL